MLTLAAILTVCFLAMIALMLTAPEGHQIEGVGFIYGPEQPFDPAQDGGKPDARRVTRAVSPLHSSANTPGAQ